MIICFLKLGILFWICLFPLHTFCFGSYYKYKFFGSYVSSFLFPPTSPIARSSSWNNDTHMALVGYKINLNFPPQVNLSRATKSLILPWAPPWRPCQHWCAIASHWSTSVCSLSSSHYLVTSPSLPTPPTLPTLPALLEGDSKDEGVSTTKRRLAKGQSLFRSAISSSMGYSFGRQSVCIHILSCHFSKLAEKVGK